MTPFCGTDRDREDIMAYAMDMEIRPSGPEPAPVQRFQEPAHDLIPGGCHTYAKGDDQFPVNAPASIVRGEGCTIWDEQGRSYVEYGMGLRSVTLGHAFPPVVEAARRALDLGTNFGRPSPLEVRCARDLLDCLPSGDMVKFAKDGSTVTTAALKLARAHTGRELVALCADHPFFSYNDWFIGTTAMDAGVSRPEAAQSLTFRYNDLASLERLFAAHPRRIACVILEPARTEEPASGFLEGVRALCDREGALLIFDEMITGFRWHLGGAQAVYGVAPDLATYGKALANGFSLSALVGRREVMELGGLRTERPRVFLLSTTHGAETHSLAAAMATMQVYRSYDVIGHLYRAGERLRAGVEAAAAAHGLSDRVRLVGRPCNLLYTTLDADGRPSQALRTLFMQELLKRRILAPSFVVSLSHTVPIIDRTVAAIDGALGVYRRALEDGVERYLEGPAVKPVYRAFN